MRRGACVHDGSPIDIRPWPSNRPFDNKLHYTVHDHVDESVCFIRMLFIINCMLMYSGGT